MTEFIVAAILWGVIGLIVTGILWVATVGATGLTAIHTLDPLSNVPRWAPPAVFTAGIIVTLGAFVLVVINTVANIISAVNVGG